MLDRRKVANQEIRHDISYPSGEMLSKGYCEFRSGIKAWLDQENWNALDQPAPMKRDFSRFKKTTRPGFEPGKTGPKPVVIPFHHRVNNREACEDRNAF